MPERAGDVDLDRSRVIAVDALAHLRHQPLVRAAHGGDDAELGRAGGRGLARRLDERRDVEPDRAHRRLEAPRLRAEVAVLGAAAGLDRDDPLDLHLRPAPAHPHLVRERRARRRPRSSGSCRTSSVCASSRPTPRSRTCSRAMSRIMSCGISSLRAVANAPSGNRAPGATGARSCTRGLEVAARGQVGVARPGADHDAEAVEAAALDRLDGQRRVVERAEAGAGDDDQRRVEQRARRRRSSPPSSSKRTSRPPAPSMSTRSRSPGARRSRAISRGVMPRHARRAARRSPAPAARGSGRACARRRRRRAAAPVAGVVVVARLRGLDVRRPLARRRAPRAPRTRRLADAGVGAGHDERSSGRRSRHRRARSARGPRRRSRTGGIA